jgi:dihydroorotate dehydrogenase
VGVGGVTSGNDVSDYLAAGADAVQVATAAMTDPGLGLRLLID